MNNPVTPPRWLVWAREIQALAQTGNNYANNDYQRQRYHRLQEIAAEIVSEHTGLDGARLGNVFMAQTGYATPRIDVRGAVFQAGAQAASGKGKLLLVRERSDGGWTLPGGWADVGDDVPSKAAEREVWEEAGFTVKAQRVVGVYDCNRFGSLELFHAFKLVFLCELLGGEATPSIETTEGAFFGREEVPGMLSAARTPPRLIQDVFAAYADPALATVFD